MTNLWVVEYITSWIIFRDYYICFVQSYRKLIALFFVALVLVTSATYYSGTRTSGNMDFKSGQENLFFVAENPTLFLYFQKKANTSGNQGWKVENEVPGFLFQNSLLVENPAFKIIHKIFVVNPDSFTTCKSLILYPYHEFS